MPVYIAMSKVHEYLLLHVFLPWYYLISQFLPIFVTLVFIFLITNELEYLFINHSDI